VLGIGLTKSFYAAAHTYLRYAKNSPGG
jgi:hypothetical protein